MFPTLFRPRWLVRVEGIPDARKRNCRCSWKEYSRTVASSSRSENKETGNGNNKQTNQCGHIAVSDRIFPLLFAGRGRDGETAEVYGR